MTLTLDPCSGPACPRCGCTDTKILEMPASKAATASPFVGGKNPAAWQGGSWWGAGRGRCNYCGAAFSFRELPAPPAAAEAPPIDETDPAGAELPIASRGPESMAKPPRKRRPRG